MELVESSDAVRQHIKLFEQCLDFSFITHLHGRGFFRTKMESLGAGHASIEPADEIWFLYGALAPVVLRPLANGNYRFLGEAYVHGIMRGDAGHKCGHPIPIMIE